MRRVGVLILLLGAGACVQGPPPTPELRGRAVYAVHDCKRCHRIGSEGGDAGPDLTFAGVRRSPEALRAWLLAPSDWLPSSVMPKFQFSDGDLSDLVAYLATLRGEAYRTGRAPWNVPGLEADPVERGRELYLRAGCAGCHGARGEGGLPNNNVPGGVVPGLQRVYRTYTAAEAAAKIGLGVRHPVKKDPEGPEPLLYMPAWREVLQEDEIAALAAYVMTLRPPSGAEEPDEAW